MFGLQEQLTHYRKVRQRIAANAKPEYDRPLRQPALPYQPPVARMRVPSLVELDAMRTVRLKVASVIPGNLLVREKADRIVREVATKHDVTVEAIHSARRPYPLMRARREAMYRVYTELRWSQNRVGQYFGKDHSSVYEALRVYKKEMQP